jgi:hypothetical protein
MTHCQRRDGSAWDGSANLRSMSCVTRGVRKLGRVVGARRPRGRAILRWQAGPPRFAPSDRLVLAALHRRPGRLPLERELRELIALLARENTSWGYVRIVGKPPKLGINVSATLVRSVLADAGIPPAPQRDRQSWRAFLRQQGDSIVACDFLTVETVWLRRLYVLVFLSLGSRRVEYVACTPNADTTSATAGGLVDGSR